MGAPTCVAGCGVRANALNLSISVPVVLPTPTTASNFGEAVYAKELRKIAASNFGIRVKTGKSFFRYGFIGLAVSRLYGRRASGASAYRAQGWCRVSRAADAPGARNPLAPASGFGFNPRVSSFSVTILGSGSAGNCALVETASSRLLVDAGLSARQITMRLAALGVTPDMLDGILLTHEHCDHVAGLRVFCRKHPLPVYCTRLTAEVLRKEELAGHADVRQFQAGAEFAIKDIGIHSFSVPHDAVDPVGFVFHHAEASLGFLTDLGHCTKLARERVRGVKTLVIETNYDEKLLQNDTRRPWAVKQRIMSRHGHLSNTAAAGVLTELLGHGLNRAVLGHLSRDCNTADLAVETVRAQLSAAGMGGDGASGVEVYCASQSEVSPRFEVA